MPSFSITRYFTVPAGGATDNLAAGDQTQLVYIDGNVTLAAGYTLAVTGSPSKGEQFTVEWDAAVTVGAFGVTIVGLTLTAQQALNDQTITCFYDGAAWKVDVHSDFNEASIVSDNNIIAGSATAGVTLAKMRDLARGSIIAGNAANRPTALDVSGSGHLSIGNGTDVIANAMSGDATIASTGVITIAAGVVTNAKQADMAANTVKVRNANSTGVPSDVALATTELLIGDGTGFTAAPLSGDAAMTHAGVVSFTGKVPMVIRQSFNATEVGLHRYRIPLKCTVTHIYATVDDDLAATDAGTVTFADNGGTGMTGTGLTAGAISIPLSSAVGAAAVTATPSGNNAFAAGEILQVTSAKPTAGGSVQVTRQQPRGAVHVHEYHNIQHDRGHNRPAH
jgi:hypothetical protein